MAFDAANHYEVSGHGVRAVVDTAGIDGRPIASLQIDGRTVDDATVSSTERGIEIDGVVAETFDAQVVLVGVILPRVNLDQDSETVSGLAILTTSRTSIGGPGLVRGSLQSYEVRPLAGTASFVES
jgi:hypothetical protein